MVLMTPLYCHAFTHTHTHTHTHTCSHMLTTHAHTHTHVHTHTPPPNIHTHIHITTQVLRRSCAQQSWLNNMSIIVSTSETATWSLHWLLMYLHTDCKKYVELCRISGIMHNDTKWQKWYVAWKKLHRIELRLSSVRVWVYCTCTLMCCSALQMLNHTHLLEVIYQVSCACNSADNVGGYLLCCTSIKYVYCEGRIRHMQLCTRYILRLWSHELICGFFQSCTMQVSLWKLLKHLKSGGQVDKIFPQSDNLTI